MSSPSFPKTTPPGHTILFVITILTICVSSLPNVFNTIDDVATIQACATPLFPNFLSRYSLGCIRVFFALFILVLSLYGMTQE